MRLKSSPLGTVGPGSKSCHLPFSSCVISPSEHLHSLLCEWDAKSHYFLEMRILQATFYSFLSTVPATKEGLKKCYYYILLSKYYTHHKQVTLLLLVGTRCFVHPEPLSFSVHGQEKGREGAVDCHTRTFVLKPDCTEE